MDKYEERANKVLSEMTTLKEEFLGKVKIICTSYVRKAITESVFSEAIENERYSFQMRLVSLESKLRRVFDDSNK